MVEAGGEAGGAGGSASVKCNIQYKLYCIIRTSTYLCLIAEIVRVCVWFMNQSTWSETILRVVVRVVVGGLGD